MTISFLALACLASLALAQEEKLVGDVLVVSQIDAFTDEEELFFFMHPGGPPPERRDRLSDRYVRANCTARVMQALAFSFDEYLRSGAYGPFHYRIDGGPMTTSAEWQDDDLVVLFHSPDRVQLVDNAAVIRQMLTGARVVVRATASDGDVDEAQYNLARLRNVMVREGCQY